MALIILLETLCEAAHLQHQHMADYIHKYVWMNLGQSVHLNYTLHYNRKEHCEEFPKSMREQGLHSGHKIICFFICLDGNPPGIALTSIFAEKCDRKVVNRECYFGLHGRGPSLQDYQHGGGRRWLSTDQRAAS